MQQRIERLNRLVDNLGKQLSSSGYADDAESSLAADLAFIALEASELNSRIRRLSQAKTRNGIRDEAIKLKDAIEHLMFHAQTGVPRLEHFIELLQGGGEIEPRGRQP